MWNEKHYYATRRAGGFLYGPGLRFPLMGLQPNTKVPGKGGLLLARVHDVAKQDKVGIPLAFNPNHSRARRSLNQDGENHVEMVLFTLHVLYR